MSDKAKLIIGDKTYEFPVIVGSEGEKAIDIAKLRAETGHITLDPGFGNTGACLSSITYIDGDQGILRYRGIPIEQLAEHSTFVETAYLLIQGRLPSSAQLADYSAAFTKHARLHPDMKNSFDGYPTTGHPMGILS